MGVDKNIFHTQWDFNDFGLAIFPTPFFFVFFFICFISSVLYFDVWRCISIYCVSIIILVTKFTFSLIWEIKVVYSIFCTHSYHITSTSHISGTSVFSAWVWFDEWQLTKRKWIKSCLEWIISLNWYECN